MSGPTNGYSMGQSSNFLGGGYGSAVSSYDAALQGLPSYLSEGGGSVPRPVGLGSTSSSKHYAGDAGYSASDKLGSSGGTNGINGMNGYGNSLNGLTSLNGHSASNGQGGSNGNGGMNSRSAYRPAYGEPGTTVDLGKESRANMFGSDLNRDSMPDMLQAPGAKYGSSAGLGGFTAHGGYVDGSSSRFQSYSPGPQDRSIRESSDYGRAFQDSVARSSDYGRVIQDSAARARSSALPEHYVEVVEAPRESRFSFPTAGSFVAEPFSQSAPVYVGAPRQPSYPSAPGVHRERSSSPMSGRAIPMYGGRPSFGGPAYAHPGGYSYSRSISPMYRGDTYSGGAISYGPPPGHYAYGPAPVNTSATISYNFPTAGSFVAEPFSPAAPRPALVQRAPSYGPPLGTYGGFGEPLMDGYASPQFGGSLLSYGAPSLIGGSSSPFLPPPTGSFMANMDPIPSFAAPALSFSQTPPAPLPIGRSSLGGGEKSAPLVGSQDFKRTASPQPARDATRVGGGPPAGAPASLKPSLAAPRPQKKTGRSGCC